MDLGLPQIHWDRIPVVGALARKAILIATILGMAWLGSMAWQAWQLWRDQPLPADRITAKQLRVNEGARTKLVQDLQTYRQSPAPTNIPGVTFQGGS